MCLLFNRWSTQLKCLSVIERSLKSIIWYKKIQRQDIIIVSKSSIWQFIINLICNIQIIWEFHICKWARCI